MLVTDLIDPIEDVLEVAPESVKKLTLPRSVSRARNYTLPGWAKPLRRTVHETQQEFAFRTFYSRLIKRGMRLMGQGCVEKPEQLLESLTTYAPDAIQQSKLRIVNPEDFDGSSSLARHAGYTWGNVDYSVQKATTFVLENFDSEAYRDFQQRGEAAGRKTKHSVDQFLETRHMTVTEAARHLGFSRPTVYAMRSYYANVNLETGEVDE
ncbi:hypothetical protein [Microbacterium sp. che218]|uniref:hypothetical protein n=1 Tax=Microbacterium sp. che218 TaxID=3140649 RepID=UPI0033669CB6